MPAKKHWESKDEHILREIYATTPVRLISQKLNKTQSEVRDRARLLGLRSLPRMHKKRPLHYYDGTPKFVVKENGCWEWIAGKNAKGYPLERGTDTTLAHRQAWIDVYGPLSGEYEIDHLCKNRSCVNIEHLEPVLHIVNVIRSKRTLLSSELVRLIRSSRDISTSQLAQQLGVTYNAVYFARRGDSWKTA